MKWNCNIVKDMYDRVLRRKFGILCKDDTSNEDFIKSYLNRLDCEPIDLSCLKGSNLPCTSDEASSTVVCNIVVNVVVTIVNNNFVFTATVSNATLPVSYNWTYDTTVFQLVSNVANVLILEPLLLNSGTEGGIVKVVVTDTDKCTGQWDDKINYRGGCTDPEAVNYDPLATIDNDSCYYNSLSMSILYNCNPNESGTVCVYATGGVPPYTVVGVPSGTIPADNGIPLCVNVRNGGSFGAYIIDSTGAVTPLETGIVNCPYDCMLADIKPNFVVTCLTDAFGNNTGQAQLYINPTGGTTPYIITVTINGGPSQPFTNGLIVNNEDNITYLITDSNGCTNSGDIDIDCPPPSPPAAFNNCEELVTFLNNDTFFQINVAITNVTPALSGDWTVQYTVNWNFIGPIAPLTLANIANVEFNINNLLNSQFLISPPVGLCGPCTSVVPYSTTVSLFSEESWNCGGGLRAPELAFVPPTNPTLQLEVDLKFNMVFPGLTCQVCTTANFSIEYDPCEPIFTPVGDSQLVVAFTLCP